MREDLKELVPPEGAEEKEGDVDASAGEEVGSVLSGGDLVTSGYLEALHGVDGVLCDEVVQVGKTQFAGASEVCERVFALEADVDCVSGWYSSGGQGSRASGCGGSVCSISALNWAYRPQLIDFGLSELVTLDSGELLKGLQVAHEVIELLEAGQTLLEPGEPSCTACAR